MPRWRTLAFPVFLAFLALSIILSVLFRQFLLLLVLPFLPVFFRKKNGVARHAAKRCPECGWATHERDAAFCSRDGHRLEPVPQPF